MTTWEFMLHSSEFMPGGSPTFKDEAAIEGLYQDLEVLFSWLSDKTVGMTLAGFIPHKAPINRRLWNYFWYRESYQRKDGKWKARIAPSILIVDYEHALG